MKIGFIWQVTYPWDVRLEKMLKACLAEGHNVSLLCRGKKGLAHSEISEGVRIERVFLQNHFEEGDFLRASTFPLFFNPLWISAVSRFLQQGAFDVVILRDLPLAFLVGKLGKRFEVRVVLDMAENYPAALRAYRNPAYRLFVIGNSWLPRQYEKLSLRLIDHILVVADASAGRLVAQGVPPQKLTVIGNTPERKFYSTVSEQPAADLTIDEKGEQNILYIGKIDKHRGVDLAVRALPKLRRDFPNVTLTIVGDGTERRRLQELALSLGIENAIRFPGWVEHGETGEYIKKSTVCLIPHLKSEHTDTTVPNKLFDYMALGKSIVASDCLPMKQIIEDVECGLAFRSGDVASLETALRKLLANPELRTISGHNGWKAIRERYNWDIDRKAFLKVLENAQQSSQKATCP